MIQPHTNPPPDDARNVDDAVNWIERAAAKGADFICFPEILSGAVADAGSLRPMPRHGRGRQPNSGPTSSSARWSRSMSAERTAYNLTCMAYPDGRPPVRYRRTHPNGPWIYASRTGGSGVWEFEWVPATSSRYSTPSTARSGWDVQRGLHARGVAGVGLARGGDHLLPAGLSGGGNLWETWHTLLRARAIENLALVVSTRNIFDPATERGLAIIAGPERTHYESINVGMSVVEVSLDRVRELRAGWDGNDKTAFCGTKQGLLSAMAAARTLRQHLAAPAAGGGRIAKRHRPWQELSRR